MDQDLYDKGMKIRREVLGDAYVDRALAKSGPFNDPLQELVTTYCWGWNWGREGLPRRDRSLINLAMMAMLNRSHELKIHIRGALNNGPSRDEIREVLPQVGTYGGIPAAGDSFRLANHAVAENDRGQAGPGGGCSCRGRHPTPHRGTERRSERTDMTIR